LAADVGAPGERSCPIAVVDAAEDAARAAMKSLRLTPTPRQRDDTVCGGGFQVDSVEGADW
jgi:hypothetical protein